jgi:hypothetical protein
MPQLHESGSPSTAGEFGQPLGLPPDSHERGYADGYIDAVRGEVDLVDGTDRTAIDLYEGFLGTVGEPMVGMPTEEELAAATPEPVEELPLPLEWKLPSNPRQAEKLANRRSHGDRRSLPRRETPPRVLRWLVDDGSEEIDDFWMDIRLRADERAASASSEAGTIDQGDSRGTGFEDAYAEGDDLGLSVYDRFELDYDSFEEARARAMEEVDAMFDEHERDEAEASIARERRYKAEVAEFNLSEDAEAARPTEVPFCNPQSVAEYLIFKASERGPGVRLWQSGSGSSQGISAGRRAA